MTDDLFELLYNDLIDPQVRIVPLNGKSYAAYAQKIPAVATNHNQIAFACLILIEESKLYDY